MTINIKFTILKTLAIFTAIVFTTPLLAKYNHEKTKVFTEEISVNEQSIVEIRHNKGPINIEYYDGDKMKVEVTLTLRGAVLTDLEKVIDNYSLTTGTVGNKVNVTSDTNIELWMTNTGGFLSKATYKIRFKNGTEINTQVTDITSVMKLMIPKVNRLELKSKHEDINISDLPFSLNVELFDGDLQSGDVLGDLNISIKHGNAVLGKTGDAKIEIFDSELKMEDAGKVELNCKHSDIEMGNMESMKMTIFDSDVILKVVEKNLDINEKHCRLTVDKMNSGTWQLFDCKVNLGEAQSLKINAKHGNYELGNIDHIEIVGYDGTFEFGNVKSVAANSFKHSSLLINKLDQSIKFNNVFDSKIEVNAVSSSFTAIEFRGKHGNLNLSLPVDSPYHLDAELRHGSIDFDKTNFEFIQHTDKGVDEVILGKHKGAGDSSPTVKIRTEDIDVDITGM